MKLVIAITGPAGADKSTVAGKLAKQIHRSVNIDVDYVKYFIVNEFVYGEGPVGQEQWRLLGKNIAMLVRNFLEADYNVIVNGYLDPPAWEEISKRVQFTHKFLLLPSLDIVKQRDKLRLGDYQQGDESVTKHHKHFSSEEFYKSFIKIDSSEHTIDETVETILRVLE